ncbi:hypothetical protein [Kitasatospora sp. NPDC093806]|uniref:hypothetical protein n=1 Tax=Kitasatospora sp. NPDC093806 TaxID=3155075 RepID=UPI0034421D24
MAGNIGKDVSVDSTIVRAHRRTASSRPVARLAKVVREATASAARAAASPPGSI